MNKNIVKNLVIILLLVACIVSVVLIFVMSTRVDSYEWRDEVEKFYNKNITTLNRFVEICFDSKINYIGTNEYFRERTDIEYMINDYFVYASEDIEDEIKNELKDIFTLFKQYKVHDVDVFKNSEVSLAMGDFHESLSLTYTKEEKSVEKIKNEKFSDYVRYIDNRWYIDK